MAKTRGMNPGGRGNRTPHRLRLVQGTERKSAGPPPTAGGGIGACPRGEPLAVRRAWRTVCREVGWLSQSSDRRALLLLARTLADLDTARAEVLAAGGPLVQTADGREVESAWSRREARLTETAGRLFRQFGMNPASAGVLSTGRETRPRDLIDPPGLGG